MWQVRGGRNGERGGVGCVCKGGRVGRGVVVAGRQGSKVQHAGACPILNQCKKVGEEKRENGEWG